MGVTPSFCLFVAVLAEKQRDAPQTGNADQCIDHAADDGHLTAAEKCDAVKAENADAAPVQGAHDREDQGESVKKHKLTSDSFALIQSYFACMTGVLFTMSYKVCCTGKFL